MANKWIRPLKMWKEMRAMAQQRNWTGKEGKEGADLMRGP